MEKCLGVAGAFFGHKYQPVITKSKSHFDSKGVKCKDYVALDMAEKYRDEILHGCICVRCGKFKGEES